MEVGAAVAALEAVAEDVADVSVSKPVRAPVGDGYSEDADTEDGLAGRNAEEEDGDSSVEPPTREAVTSPPVVEEEEEVAVEVGSWFMLAGEAAAAATGGGGKAKAGEAIGAGAPDGVGEGEGEGDGDGDGDVIEVADDDDAAVRCEKCDERATVAECFAGDTKEEEEAEEEEEEADDTWPATARLLSSDPRQGRSAGGSAASLRRGW